MRTVTPVKTMPSPVIIMYVPSSLIDNLEKKPEAVLPAMLLVWLKEKLKKITQTCETRDLHIPSTSAILPCCYLDTNLAVSKSKSITCGL